MHWKVFPKKHRVPKTFAQYCFFTKPCVKQIKFDKN